MNPLKVWIIAFLLVLGLFTTPMPALACSCAPAEGPEDELERVTVVFSGRGVAVEAPGPVGGIISTADIVKYTFQVTSVWKGPLSPVLVVSSARSEDSCGYEFRKGVEYLVYASGAEHGLDSSLCSRTRPLDEAAEDLQALGKGHTPQPASSLEPAWLPVVLWSGAGLVVLGILAAVWIFNVRKRSGNRVKWL